MQYMGPCIFSLPISLIMVVRRWVLYRITIIISEVWPICHCLELGHETMVCTVCLFIFLFLWNSSRFTGPYWGRSAYIFIMPWKFFQRLLPWYLWYLLSVFSLCVLLLFLSYVFSIYLVLSVLFFCSHHSTALIVTGYAIIYTCITSRNRLKVHWSMF